MASSDLAAARLPVALEGGRVIDEHVTAIVSRMLDPDSQAPGLPIVDVTSWLDESSDPIARVAAAFLVAVAGEGQPSYARAMGILSDPPSAVDDLATFERTGLARIAAESDAGAIPAELEERFVGADADLAGAVSELATSEAIWQAFFPQAVGIRDHEDERIRDLRSRRTISIERSAPDPITDPAREVLFTSNVLLTLPDTATDIETLPYPVELREAIRAATAEPQRYWYDHPIQIGVEPAANELLYGLRGLDAAIDAEDGADRVTCLLSVSVTHDSLAPIARGCIEAELARGGHLRHVDVVVVTEADTRRLVDEVLLPVLGDGGASAAAGLHEVVGVDGRYGRHYSFLKAVAALWHVAIDPVVQATFKIDLDQVFPQDVLLAETGRTMFGHLATPLWGAVARDADGGELELGMLAGALVNERDIGQGLFTPDVPIPDQLPTADEHVFFSGLPQSISTRAEMMERYDGPSIDGTTRALERIHVTGGTNGIRVDALRRYRPFTPTWVGRAEDQAYLLSALGRPGPRLAYAHAAGLIMRHDKEVFAGQAMAAAHVGKLIGDDERILVFSAYVEALIADGANGAAVRRLLDPFTGCFVSDIPQTLVLLRLALRTLRLFAEGHVEDAREYATDGARRIAETLQSYGDPVIVGHRLVAERTAWGHYYDALDALEAGIAEDRPGAIQARSRAVGIIDDCRVGRAS